MNKTLKRLVKGAILVEVPRALITLLSVAFASPRVSFYILYGTTTISLWGSLYTYYLFDKWQRKRRKRHRKLERRLQSYPHPAKEPS